MHGLIFETSVWLLAESTRLLIFVLQKSDNHIISSCFQQQSTIVTHTRWHANYPSCRHTENVISTNIGLFSWRWNSPKSTAIVASRRSVDVDSRFPIPVWSNFCDTTLSQGTKAKIYIWLPNWQRFAVETTKSNSSLAIERQGRAFLVATKW